MIESKNDFEFQVQYILSQSRRLLDMQDTNTSSYSYGCFHYAYWRDKTSEFADTRFQEASATALLMTHPLFSEYTSGVPVETLKKSFSAGLLAWQKQQNADGSFDEWYKNEHGFAATCFSLLAFSLAIYFCRPFVTDEDLEIYKNVAIKASSWLQRNDDFVKLNHQAAGACALILSGTVCSRDDWIETGKIKVNSVLSCQEEEGWFREISGMDLGYCFVLLDYMMLSHHFVPQHNVVVSMKKLFDFVSPFIQPNLTISPEAGLCLNPYVSRVGVILLSGFHSPALEFVSQLATRSPNWEGIRPYLSDDLRLCRWSHLPLVAWLFFSKQKERFLSTVSPLQSFLEKMGPPGVFFEKAGIGRQIKDGVYVGFYPSAGGLVRAFLKDQNNPANWKLFEAPGYLLMTSDSRHIYVHSFYNPKRFFSHENSHFVLESWFVKAKFVFPGFFLRLGLRILCSVPGLARYVRMAIDSYRKLNNTAINQSVAPASTGKSHIKLIRKVSIEKNQIEIKDKIVKNPKVQGSFKLNYFDIATGAKIIREFKSQESELEIRTNWHF
jgi:hypothetical protein